MQGQIRSTFSHGSVLKNAVIQRLRLVNPALRPLLFARQESVQAACIEEHGFESTTISDILKTKGKSADGSWLWCATDDTVKSVKKVVNTRDVYWPNCFSLRRASSPYLKDSGTLGDVYKKQLRLSNAAKLIHSSSEIMNYVTMMLIGLESFRSGSIRHGQQASSFALCSSFYSVLWSISPFCVIVSM